MVEKTKKWALVIGLFLIGVVLVSAGCVEETPKEEAPPGETTTTTTQTSTDETPTATSSSESLADLLGKARSTTSVKYDMVTTSPGEPTETVKMWEKGDKRRMEVTTDEGKTVIMITNGLDTYIYNPEENSAIKMSFDDFSDAPESAVEEIQSLMDDYEPMVVGVETIDGKLCTVVESTYSTEVMGKSYEIKTKSWIWQKRGLPIRIEETSSLGGVDKSTTVTEMKNIDFGNILDSTFELPKGV
ncbi:MAG TPA: outer membrane lipoprotein-sorting protein, partial [Methanophagales archaeon]|nr:outer membrane lipoprotein-sorting protein [Methanophagales archaeon]